MAGRSGVSLVVQMRRTSGDGCRSFCFSIGFCSGLKEKMFAHIYMKSLDAKASKSV